MSYQGGGPVFVMKRLLLSLCLIGAVFSGHAHLVVKTDQGPPKKPVETRAGSPLTRPAMPRSTPQFPNSGVEEAKPQMTRQDAHPTNSPAEDIPKAPPITDDLEPSAAEVPEGKNLEANWVVVIRWATVHWIFGFCTYRWLLFYRN